MQRPWQWAVLVPFSKKSCALACWLVENCRGWAHGECRNLQPSPWKTSSYPVPKGAAPVSTAVVAGAAAVVVAVVVVAVAGAAAVVVAVADEMVVGVVVVGVGVLAAAPAASAVAGPLCGAVVSVVRGFGGGLALARRKL